MTCPERPACTRTSVQRRGLASECRLQCRGLACRTADPGAATMNPRISRRSFIKVGMAGGAALFLPWRLGPTTVRANADGPSLDPGAIPKYVTPLLIPPVMPRAATINARGGKPIDYYEISMRQFEQQILPAPLGATTVWGYGAISSASNRGLLIHNAPSLTIEAKWGRPVRVKWVNELVDDDGHYLPHLLPVDQTLHWANPPAEPRAAMRDQRSPLRPARTPGLSRSSRTCMAPSMSATRAMATPSPGTCRPRATSRLSSRPRALGTTFSRPRPTRDSAPSGAQDPPPSSTRTPSANRRSGITTMRSE